MGKNKTLEIAKDELLREEKESNPKEYSKLHCLNLYENLDMKTQEKNHWVSFLYWQPTIDFIYLILYM